MTPEELKAIKARADAATPGPWESTVDRSDPRGDRSDWIIGSPERVIVRESRPWYWNEPPRRDSADHDFIAHARTDIPALLAAVEERDKRIAELEQIGESKDGAIQRAVASAQRRKDENAALRGHIARLVEEAEDIIAFRPGLPPTQPPDAVDAAFASLIAEYRSAVESLLTPEVRKIAEEHRG